jgi:hypothetical protein
MPLILPAAIDRLAIQDDVARDEVIAALRVMVRSTT